MNQNSSNMKTGRLSLAPDSFASSNTSLMSISNLLGNDSKFILSVSGVNELSREVNQNSSGSFANGSLFQFSDYMDKEKKKKESVKPSFTHSKVSTLMSDSWDDFDQKFNQTYSQKEETFQRIEDFQNENDNVSISDSEFVNMSLDEKAKLLDKGYEENENLKFFNEKSFSYMGAQESFQDPRRGDRTIGEYFLMNSSNPCNGFSLASTPRAKNYLPNVPNLSLNRNRSVKKEILPILKEVSIEENSIFNSFQRSMLSETKDDHYKKFNEAYQKKRLEAENARYNLSDGSITRGLRELDFDISEIEREGAGSSLATSTPRNSIIPFTSVREASRNDSVETEKNDKTLTPKAASKMHNDLIPTKELETSRKITPNTTYASVQSEGSGSSFAPYHPFPIHILPNQQQQMVVTGTNLFPGYPIPQIYIQIQCPCHQGEHKNPLNVSTVSSCVGAGNGRNSPERPNLSTDKEKIEWPVTTVGGKEIEDITFINNSAKELKINCRIITSNQRRTFFFLNAFESSKGVRTEYSEFTIVLPRGESKKYEVSFSPKEVGEHVGEIKIKFHIQETSAPTVAFKAKIPLSGRGK